MSVPAVWASHLDRHCCCFNFTSKGTWRENKDDNIYDACCTIFSRRPCATTQMLNNVTRYESLAAGKQQAWALSGLISLCCHSACCLLSITEWVYHAIDNVSTTMVRQAGKAWWMGQLIWHSKIGQGWRPEPVQMDKIIPPTPVWNGFAWGRMKYACIVYLKKSISFPHLQINRYNGIVDIDLLSLWHSQSP